MPQILANRQYNDKQSSFVNTVHLLTDDDKTPLRGCMVLLGLRRSLL